MSTLVGHREGPACSGLRPPQAGPFQPTTTRTNYPEEWDSTEDLGLDFRKQLKNYERMKMLVDKWIDLSTELSNLRITQNRT
jgi:hypothetical protein